MTDTHPSAAWPVDAAAQTRRAAERDAAERLLAWVQVLARRGIVADLDSAAEVSDALGRLAALTGRLAVMAGSRQGQ